MAFNDIKLKAAKWLLQGMASGAQNVKANPAGRVMMAGLSLIGTDQRNPRQMVKEGYQMNVPVYRCIKEICTAMSTIEVEAVRTRLNGEEEVLDNHPLLTLLKRPNPRETWADFITHLVTDWRITGEYFIVRTPSPKGAAPAELWLLPPSNMKVKPSETGMAAEYEYQGASGTMRFPVDLNTGDCLIYHGLDYNPNDQWRGQSPLMAAGLPIDILNHGLIWNKALLKNGARPTGVLVLPSVVSADEYSQMQNEIDILYSGSVNAGRPMLLEGGLEWKDMGTTPKDMDFLNSIKEMSQQVASALGVPFALVNPDSATYSNMETANLMLYEKTVVPLLNSVLTGFNLWLGNSTRDGVILRVNEDSISALESRRVAKATRMATLARDGILTRDEVRQELGYSALGGLAASLLVGSGLMPIDDAGLADTAIDQSMPEDEEALAVQKALIDTGYSADEASSMVARDFNMKGGDITHFPLRGMNKPVDVRNSLAPEAPLGEAEALRNAYPELWAKGGALAEAGFAARREGPLTKEATRTRERMAQSPETSLASVIAKLAWGIYPPAAKQLLDAEKRFADTHKAPIEHKNLLGCFVKASDGKVGRVIVASKGAVQVRLYEPTTSGGYIASGVGNYREADLAQIASLD